MSEDLSILSQNAIAAGIKRLYKTEKIVNHEINQTQWNIKHLYGNTLWIQLLDEPDADTVVSGSLVLPVASAKGMYRLGKILKCGPKTEFAKEGEYVKFMHNVGQPWEKSVDGYKTWVIREDAIMAVVDFDGDEQALQKHLLEDVHTQIK